MVFLRGVDIKNLFVFDNMTGKLLNCYCDNVNYFKLVYFPQS